MRKEVTNMQYAIAHLDQDGNGDSDKNPYISVDFENNLESCLEAANMMEDEDIRRSHRLSLRMREKAVLIPGSM